MSIVQRHVVSVTTDGAGAATSYSPVVTGRLLAIHYVKTDFTDGVDFTITAEATGESLWTGTNVNASVAVYPRGPQHDLVGAARLYAAAGQAVADLIGLANDRVKIVIAAGGATKTGAFHIVLG